MKIVIDFNEDGAAGGTVSVTTKDGVELGPYVLLDGVTVEQARFTGRLPNEVMWAVQFRTEYVGEQIDGRASLEEAIKEMVKD